MYNNPPDLPLLTNPVGVDSAIQSLQIELKDRLVWLQKSFGRSYVGRMQRPSSPLYLYPAIYIGSSEVYDASPNDNLTSYSFFEVEGQYRPEDYENSGLGGTNTYTSPVSLVVWGNLLKVNPLLSTPYSDQNFSHNLLHDILAVIRENYDSKVTGIEDNIYTVFEPYTCRQDDPTLFYYPYFCFKIRLELAWKEECTLNNA